MTSQFESYEVRRTPEFSIGDQPVPQFRVGQETPILKPVEEAKDLPSYGEAFFNLSEIGAISRIGESAVDRAVSLFDKELSLDYVDPSFDDKAKIDAFEAYRKRGIFTDDDFNFVMHDIDNRESFAAFANEREEMLQAYQKMESLGPIAGGASQFLAAISGPSVLFGYGAAKMLSSGMKARSAYAISGAAAGATAEVIKQAGDIGEVVTPTESAITIGAAALLSGVMGQVVDSWAARAAKKAAGPVDFNKFATSVVNEGVKADRILKDGGAAAVQRDPEMSKMVGGWLARSAAWAYRPLSAKARGVTAIDDETRVAYDKFTGRSLMTKGDVAGEVRKKSFLEEDGIIRGKFTGMARKFVDDLIAFERSAKTKITQADLRAAVLRAVNKEDALDDGTASALVAKFHREFYGEWDRQLIESGIEGYSTRADFGIPMLFDPSIVKARQQEVIDKLVRKFMESKKFLQEDIDILKDKIARLEKQVKSESSVAKTEILQRRLQAAINESVEARSFLDMSDEVFQMQAEKLALAMSRGDFQSINFSMPLEGKVLPQRFRERVFDIRDWHEFIVVDPIHLQDIYTRQVSPFLASQRTFREKTPEGFVASVADKLDAKIIEAKNAGNAKLANRLEGERRIFVNDAKNAWDDLTGGTINRFGELTRGAALPTVLAIKAYTAASSLGAALLASINELNVNVLYEGLKGNKKAWAALGKALTSPEFRKLNRKEAYHLSFATSTALQMRSLSMADQAMGRKEILGASFADKTSAVAQILSNLSQVANGMITFTDHLRMTLNLAQQGILHNSLEMLVNGSIDQARKTDLAFLGISTKEQARRLLAQIKKHGTDDANGFRWNIEKWDNKESAELADLILYRDNRRKSLQPDVGDTPHLFRVPGFNLLFQFKSWAVTAGQTYGIGVLQRTDRRSITNAAMFVGFSGLSYQLAEIARGNEPVTDLDELVYSALTTSGFLSIAPDVGGHFIMSKLFDLESGGAKFAERQDLLSTIAGPFGSKAQDVTNAIGRPIAQAIDPDREVEFDDVFWKNMLDLLPIPFVKPYIKNEILTED
jgi:hypothetical protein